MKKQPFTPPTYNLSAYNCPFCNAFSNQIWLHAKTNGSYIYNDKVTNTDFSFCTHCEEYSIWFDTIMVYPDSLEIESPNEDLNKDIIDDYLEARSILQKSPRGAAALLRLALQKLCKQLGEEGKDINKDIAALVKKGLSITIQQALDSLRVIGNEAVHPGQMNLKDDTNTATSLFKLLNKIADSMITQPKEINEIYNTIPDSKKEAIKMRDTE